MIPNGTTCKARRIFVSWWHSLCLALIGSCYIMSLWSIFFSFGSLHVNQELDCLLILLFAPKQWVSLLESDSHFRPHQYTSIFHFLRSCFLFRCAEFVTWLWIVGFKFIEDAESFAFLAIVPSICLPTNIFLSLMVIFFNNFEILKVFGVLNCITVNHSSTYGCSNFFFNHRPRA